MSKKEEKEQRKDKRSRKRKWLQAQTQTKEVDTAGKRDRLDASDGGDEGEDDWITLAKEERLAKKVKRGAMSQATFDAEFVDMDI